MADSWSFENGAASTVYCSASGMVGAINSRGAWAMWIPPEGSDFRSMYGGVTHRVVNVGGGRYGYTRNEEPAQLLAYAQRWLSSRFFDAAGNPVASFDAASVAGEPGAVYHQPGSVVASGTATTSGGASQSSTRSSDGRSDIWTSLSGMAGVQNSRGAWVIFLPSRGLVIESTYGGETIRTENQGDGTYTLKRGAAAPTRHAYDPRWLSGTLFDARGTPIAQPADANATGDPSVFFTPGAVIAASGTGSGGGTRPTAPPTTQPPPAVPQPPLPPITSGGGDSGGGGFFPGGGGGGGGGSPVIAPFPEPVTVAPGEPNGGQSSKAGLAVLAAVAAAVLFS